MNRLKVTDKRNMIMNDNEWHNETARLRREWEQEDREMDALDAKCKDLEQKLIDAARTCANATGVIAPIAGVMGLGLAIAGANDLALMFGGAAGISFVLQSFFSGRENAHVQSTGQPPQHNI